MAVRVDQRRLALTGCGSPVPGIAAMRAKAAIRTLAQGTCQGS